MKDVKYNSRQKICATCCKWVGNRSITDNQDYAIVADSATGKCMGKYKPKIRSGKEKQSCWQKWEFLDESNNQKLIQDLRSLADN